MSRCAIAESAGSFVAADRNTGAGPFSTSQNAKPNMNCGVVHSSG